MYYIECMMYSPRRHDICRLPKGHNVQHFDYGDRAEQRALEKGDTPTTHRTKTTKEEMAEFRAWKRAQQKEPHL